MGYFDSVDISDLQFIIKRCNVSYNAGCISMANDIVSSVLDQSPYLANIFCKECSNHFPTKYHKEALVTC
jgi:hypothetical protein